jgi:hypothetical protein
MKLVNHRSLLSPFHLPKKKFEISRERCHRPSIGLGADKGFSRRLVIQLG